MSTEVRHQAEILFFSEENCWTISGLSTYALNNNILWVGTQSNPIDCLATYHKARGGDLNSGCANAIFVDGHVGTGLAKDTYKLTYPKRK